MLYKVEIDDYIKKISIDRKLTFENLINKIDSNLPKGFDLIFQYNMPTWVISLSDYPAGYHCKPNTPLPFISLANQKNFISLYHIGLYSDENLSNWFKTEYVKFNTKKIDMGKSCIRFKNTSDIPFELIGELCNKMSPKDWIEIYENNLKK